MHRKCDAPHTPDDWESDLEFMSEPRNAQLSVRLSGADRDLLSAAAAVTRESSSGFVRRAAIAQARAIILDRETDCDS